MCKNKDNGDYVNHQIYRMDGTNCFLEVLNDCFPINKVHIGFNAYNTNNEPGSRITKSVHIYISINKFLLWQKNMLNGTIPRLAEESKKKADAESARLNRTIDSKPILQVLGGTSASDLANSGHPRADGKCLSRIFELSIGSKKPYIMIAKSGPGRIDSQGHGLIVPDGPSENVIIIPFTADDLKEFFLCVAADIHAYKAAYYVKNFDILYSNSK